jgi:hypothetical protein
MTTIAQLITDAYQYNNLVALTSIPTAEEQDKGLRYFNRIFRGVFGSELGDSLSESNVGFSTGSELVVPNTRYLCNANSSKVFRLPPTPRDGSQFSVQDVSNTFATHPATVDPNGRKIEGTFSLLLNDAGFSGHWFYRADLGDWLKISSLETDSLFPLPEEFEEFFIIMLALRLNSSEGLASSPELSAIMRDVSKKFRARYRQTTTAELDLGLTSLSAGDNGTTSFNLGQ